MNKTIDIHPASAEERTIAFRQAHEAWGGNTEIEQFVRARKRSIQHKRARWWVLTRMGKVCASLGSYPLRFVVEGREVAGFGLGAVYTAPEERRRGYAEQLCRHVAAAEQAAGCEVGLLFSDISPDYYAKLGWHVVGDSLYKADVADLWEPTPGLGVRIRKPHDRIASLNAMWEATEKSASLWLKRPDDYWRYILTRSPEDHHVMLCDKAGLERGYMRIHIDGMKAHIHEILLPQGIADAWLDSAWALAAHYAASQGAEYLSTWQEPAPRSRPLWDEAARGKAITMMLWSGQTAEQAPSACSIHDTDHF
jgi:predicted acetyltransferase